MINQYIKVIEEKLNLIRMNEIEKLTKAAEKAAQSIAEGGIIHLFGCGHSHILTEEVCYRAGGLVPINPILYEPLMLHEGALKSSQLERQNDLAETFINNIDIQSKDIVFVISTSGRNPVPVDVALYAKNRGAFTIGITSYEYSNSQPSRHKDAKYLYNSVDFYIENYSAIGDASLYYEKVAVPFGPTSTVIGATILNAIFAETIKILSDKGIEPPVFLSGNIDGADEHNKRLIEKYQHRVEILK